MWKIKLNAQKAETKKSGKPATYGKAAISMQGVRKEVRNRAKLPQGV